MFEVATQFMVQLVNYIPAYIGLWLVFDFLGALFFGSK